MKFPLDYPCAGCGRPQRIFIKVTENSFSADCKDYGHPDSAILGTDISIGDKLLARALHEIIETKDFSLAVIASAAAVDCELSHLYRKWSEIDELDLRWPTDAFYMDIEKEFRNFKTIAEKVGRTSKMLVNSNLDDFVGNKAELKNILATGFPTLHGDIIGGSQRHLFWKRNEALHNGEIEFDEAIATKAFNIGRFLIKVLKEADKERRNSMTN